MRILKLTLSKAPFEVMVTGEKYLEFRKPSKWIKSRLYNKDGTKRDYEAVQFVNGYGSDKPQFTAKYVGFLVSGGNFTENYSNGLKVEIKKGDFIINLGTVVEVKNLKQCQK